MAASLLQNGKLDAEKNAQMASSILRTSRRMNFLIEDLLDASQTAQGNEILFQITAGDLRGICQPIIEDFRIAYPKRQIEFIAPEDCCGRWDAGRLGQVLANLVSNAICYGNPQFPVTVNLASRNETAVLQITNQGEAISQEVKNNLFNPFWRGAKKVGEGANSSGLGLGLYIVSQIVKAHGGTVTVESNEDDGTTFIVILPCESEAKN